MEGTSYLTSGDLAMWDNSRYGRHYEGDCGHRGGGVATAIGLGAAGLAVALVGAWGINQASKARTDGTQKSLDIMTAGIMQERQRTDGINLYIEQSLRNSASATGGNAEALAFALATNRFGGNYGGQVCPQPVALYSPAMPCSCPNSGSCGC